MASGDAKLCQQWTFLTAQRLMSRGWLSAANGCERASATRLAPTGAWGGGVAVGTGLVAQGPGLEPEQSKREGRRKAHVENWQKQGRVTGMTTPPST